MGRLGLTHAEAAALGQVRVVVGVEGEDWEAIIPETDPHLLEGYFRSA